MVLEPKTTVISEDKSYGSDLASKHIINAINSMAKIKMEKIKLQQSNMLDQLERKRNLEDYQGKKDIDANMEQKKQQGIMDMFGGGQAQPQAQPQAPQQTSPAETQAPAMSLEGGGVGDVTGQPMQEPQDTGAPEIQPTLQGITLQKPPPIKTINGRQYKLTMKNGKMGMSEIDSSEFIYSQIYKQLEQGQSISEGSERRALEYNGIKPIDIQERKFAYKLEEDQLVKDRQSNMVKDAANDTLNTINEVEKGMKYFGPFGGTVPPQVWESDKINWLANYNKLISKRVLNVMTELKQASRTGATGFGQLSEKELKVLMDASTVLKRNMSEEDARRYLNEMKTSLMTITQGDGAERDMQGVDESNIQNIPENAVHYSPSTKKYYDINEEELP